MLPFYPKELSTSKATITKQAVEHSSTQLTEFSKIPVLLQERVIGRWGVREPQEGVVSLHNTGVDNGMLG